MKEIVLAKLGEIALKGLNRRYFESLLVKNLKHRLADLGAFRVQVAQSTIYIEPEEESADMDEALEVTKKVFGIVSVSKALEVEKDLDLIMAKTCEYLHDELSAARTFKVFARRADKQFAHTSPEICRRTGEYILERFPHLSVDVHHPDFVAAVEIRDFAAYIHCAQQPAIGGMPVGSNGRAALLLSGGIDSPVAGFLTAKRGVELIGIHFFSYPYTSERAKQKVFDLTKILAQYAGDITVYVVPFTHIQEEIRQKCPEDHFTLIMRRYMMKIAEQLALRHDCQALITGESIGQVASQTIQALGVTDQAVKCLPVFRPLIGLDKEDIVKISREIGTFATSILPYEDCCTVFTPKHPKTKPNLEEVLRHSAVLDEDALVSEAVAGTQAVPIKR